MVGTKRRREDDDDDTHVGTPSKLRTQIIVDGPDDAAIFQAQTPSRKGRPQHLADNGTPKSILKKSGLANAINGTPKSTRKLVFETPSKSIRQDTPEGTPTLVRNADRSARRKSNRRILERTLNGADSDEEALEEEDMLAEHILDGDAEETDPAIHVAVEEEAPIPETPSKRGRGRPKGSGKVGRPRKQPSPTPPAELPPHEEYFWQNRPGGTKTSNNTLSAQSLLNHDEYFDAIQSYQDRHVPEMDFLLELHSRAHDQWIFELEEGFNICLYGYGSKRTITERFTAHLYRYLSERTPYQGTKKSPKIVVVNGYSAGITMKDILTAVASTVIASTVKLPNQISILLEVVLAHLSDNPPPHPIPIILNSIDSAFLRRSATTTMLARLAADRNIHLIATADTPNFPLLWDVGLKTQYNFLFHDATTFAPYTAEIDTVETVNELLSRSGRRVGGRDGVGFVLRSLPTNARLLFRELVMEQLALSLMEGGEFDDDDDEEVNNSTSNTGKKTPIPKIKLPESSQGVEYRVLYHKAVEAFICTSEVSFRTLLKEFHDHQMIESRKDAMGTERLWVPFSQEELEALAEDLANEI
ncbi:Origin recognition complex subunit 2 [Coniothyrium glycines]